MLPGVPHIGEPGPQWGRLVDSRITRSPRTSSATSRVPQWGRLVESRITSNKEETMDLIGKAAMGPARGEPDHPSARHTNTARLTAAMGPARGEPDHGGAVMAGCDVEEAAAMGPARGEPDHVKQGGNNGPDRQGRNGAGSWRAGSPERPPHQHGTLDGRNGAGSWRAGSRGSGDGRLRRRGGRRNGAGSWRAGSRQTRRKQWT